MLKAQQTYLQRWFSAWLEKRLPLQSSVKLDRTRIFIVPTWQGMLLLLVAMLILLLAINFESALNYAIAFWLISMLWVAVHLTYRNLSGLTVNALSGSLVEVGEIAEVNLKLTSGNNRNRGVFEVIGEPWGVVFVPMHGAEATFKLCIKASRRGPVVPPRFRIENRHPFGLVMAWTHVHIDVAAWAFPEPKPFPRKALSAGSELAEEAPDDHFYASGSEDFHSLRAYSQGDPIQRLHWPSFSRDQLVVKHFTDYQSADESIQWSQFAGLSDEDRLAAIRYYSEAFFTAGLPYSVSMPGMELATAKGSEHIVRVRRALAEYGYV
jgi:uncharacterized protein (DUF58 family)